ncbi:hypothetical protein [Zunongwangia profunda]|uniref:hypothetical protein n=1 Tax=Zunongwangia profunda TaxID=398743 RepID=UPI00248E54BE|nr:hypothetical protein [Zunongwangia profunda]
MEISELIEFIEQLPNRKGTISISEVEVSVQFLTDHIPREILKKIIEVVPNDFYVMDGKIYFSRK